ncbi:MAG: GAF domain-containing protein [Thermoplasmata archaeon]|nr:GAF domain-containing protein [Thermoplasmata archaeon]
MYSVVLISDNKQTLKLSKKFLTHFKPEISLTVISSISDMVNAVKDDRTTDAIVIEETDSLKFVAVVNAIGRANIDLPIILFSKICNPKMMADAINNHIDNYLCTDGMDPSDYYQELSKLIVYSIERDRIDIQHDQDVVRYSALVELAKMSPYNFPSILNHAVEKAVQMTSSKAGYVSVYDKSSGMLSMMSWTKNIGEFVNDIESSVDFPIESAGIFAEPISTGRAVVIDDFEKYEASKETGLDLTNVKRILIVPIKVSGEIIGTAGVINKVREYNSSDEYQVQHLFQDLYTIENATMAKSRFDSDVAIMRYTLEYAPIGMVYVNKYGKITVINKTASDLMGISGYPLPFNLALANGEVADVMREMIGSASKKKAVRDKIVTIRGRRWALAMSGLKQDSVEGYNFVFTDITDVATQQSFEAMEENVPYQIVELIVKSLNDIDLQLKESMSSGDDLKLSRAMFWMDFMVDFINRFMAIGSNESRWVRLSDTIKDGLNSFRSENVSEIVSTYGVHVFVNESFKEIFYVLKRISCTRGQSTTFIQVDFSIDKGELSIRYKDDGSYSKDAVSRAYGSAAHDRFGFIMIEKICRLNGMKANWISTDEGMNLEITVPSERYRLGL